MLANINHLLVYFGLFTQDIIVSVILMVSLVIFTIGFFKPILFDKIRNKDLRRGALALANIGACFITALVYFLWEGWEFKYYPIAAVALTLASIFAYYAYETVPGVRKFIGGLGYTAMSKIFNIGILAATSDNPETVKTELTKVESEIKDKVRAELKASIDKVKANLTSDIKKPTQQVKVDKDLKNL